MADIKGTLEMLTLVETVAVDFKAVLADGKADWTDIPKLANLWAPARDALTDLPKIPGEIHDLSVDEVKAILSKLVEVVQACVAVFPHVPAAA
jgi:hypothetical protein